MPHKIFLSCARMKFRSARGLIAQHLEAVRRAPFAIKAQEDFQQGGHALRTETLNP